MRRSSWSESPRDDPDIDEVLVALPPSSVGSVVDDRSVRPLSRRSTTAPTAGGRRIGGVVDHIWR
nr:hypothetical protein ISGA_11440 [Gordonia sp. NB41Y]